ncbi:MAG TPA: radical SAM protein [Phycisphaerae bacterium]|nr:radical SAM protein [Phycisphaerae bacterium]HOM50057.1 radical SAM protein [Phycisphaerae bacterium]HPP26640.1 radical SAM protein [Phycisphaerae bacterium]
MRIVLIATQTVPVALGLRHISSYLKAAGHDMQIVFLHARGKNHDIEFDAPELEPLFELCRSAELIGLSVMTSGYYKACALTEGIRRRGINAPVIWGGTHPTVAPEESLEVADAICRGEGEEPMRQLVECLATGRDPTSTPGFSFRAGGRFGNAETIVNAVMPLTKSLDDYPFPDYDLDTHWVLHEGELKRARPELLGSALQRLRVSTTRGCPCSCTFCNNTVWQELYRGKGRWVRKRSNESIVSEIKSMIARFPSIESVNIIDDLFLVRSEPVLEDFVRVWNREIRLPLEIDVFPNTVTEAKVRILSRLPLRLISMGIQSGSPHTLAEVYNRPTSIEQISRCIDLFHKYGLRAEYHYIFGNPYESEENVIESMRFVASHHKGPAVLRVFPLIFYPGSPLYKRALADDLIGKHHDDAYAPRYTWKRLLARYDYLAMWLDIVLQLRNAMLPSWLVHRLIDVVTSRPVRACLDHRVFLPLLLIAREGLRRIGKAMTEMPALRRRPPATEDTSPAVAGANVS